MHWEPADRWPGTAQGGFRARREDYLLSDGRKHPVECDHTQFLDITVSGIMSLILARCLDCGHVVRNGDPRTLYYDYNPELLTDDELLEQRAAHRLIWFGNIYLPEGVSPGK